MKEIKLTRYSSAAGCGCKIDAEQLKNILLPALAKDRANHAGKNKLFIGNENNEDAAAYDLGDGNFLLSTVDFFTPVVDDAYDFGYVAAANAISDIYAMGGKPVFALSVLGWPLKDIPESVASRVAEGAGDACAAVDIPIAGGHSIENREPVFGLVVNGIVSKDNIKLNCGAREGDILYLTKPLGAGILTTAIKKELITKNDHAILLASLKKINSIGYELGKISNVHAMTDVTGFGLAGHLIEMSQASEVSAAIDVTRLTSLVDLTEYIAKDSLPGGLHKNWKNYAKQVDAPLHGLKEILADPQTNGGLLVAVDPSGREEVEALFSSANQWFCELGVFKPKGKKAITLL